MKALESIALLSPIQAARGYNFSKFRQDFVAGLTVAVVAVPQSMAYAMIAGVPPVYGLYTAIVQGLLASLFTSSSHLSTGPINTLSLLVASAVARIAGDTSAPDYAQMYLQLVIAMTLMVGLLQLAFAAARMASLVQYVSHSVIVGFTAGAGILIAAGQIPSFLGIGQSQIRNLPGLLGIIERMLPYLKNVDAHALTLGCLALAIVIAARSISRFIPGPLLAAIVGGAIVALSGWKVKIVGDLPQALPSFHLPHISWQLAEELLGGAFALGLVGMLEAYSIAKAISAKTGERINPDREFLAQGFSNFISSFFQCVPGSGSFSRSALTYQAGARTSLTGIYNSILIAVIFLVFAPMAKYIPHASLAAILFVIAYGLIDWHFILRTLPASRSDATVCIATMVATLLIPLEFAILVGIFLNIGLYLRRASRLHISEMVQRPGGPFIERPLRDRQGNRKVIFLHIEGDLFFAIADQFQDRLLEVTNSNVKVAILRLKRTHSIDATVLHVLEAFVQEMRKRGRFVVLCGIRPELLEVLRNYGMVDLVGQSNIFVSGEGVFAAARQAVARARELVGSSIDEDDISFADDIAEEFAYQI